MILTAPRFRHSPKRARSPRCDAACCPNRLVPSHVTTRVCAPCTLRLCIGCGVGVLGVLRARRRGAHLPRHPRVQCVRVRRQPQKALEPKATSAATGSLGRWSARAGPREDAAPGVTRVDRSVQPRGEGGGGRGCANETCELGIGAGGGGGSSMRKTIATNNRRRGREMTLGSATWRISVLMLLKSYHLVAPTPDGLVVRSSA